MFSLTPALSRRERESRSPQFCKYPAASTQAQDVEPKLRTLRGARALETAKCYLFLACDVQRKRNLTLVFGVFYGIDTVMSAENKYLEEHLPKTEDFFITRRQFLQRAGMGFGALSLATLLGEELIGTKANAIETVATLLPKSPQ